MKMNKLPTSEAEAVAVEAEELSALAIDKDLEEDGHASNVEDILDKIGFGYFQWKMLFLCALGYFAVCAELLITVLISQLLLDEFHISRYTFAWLPFTTTLASLSGGMIWGYISDLYGRQIPFIVTIVIAAVGGCLSAYAPTFKALIALRAVTAFGTGGITCVDFAMFLEFIPRADRGKYMTTITAAGSLGVLAIAGLAWGMMPVLGWRYLLLLCASTLLMLAAVRVCISYESPRYLLVTGDTDGAHEVLTTMARQNGVSPSTIPDKLSYAPSQSRGSLLAIFGPEFRAATILLSFAWLFQSLGYWGITMYLPAHFKRLGFNGYEGMFLMVSAEFPGLALSAFLVDHRTFGRRRTLLLFLLATAMSLLLFAFIGSSAGDVFLAVLSMMVYFFMIPNFANLHTYTGETFPTTLRSTATGFLNLVTSIPGLVTPFASAWLLSSSIVWLYPALWACCFLMAAIAVFWLGRETSRVALADVPQSEEQDAGRGLKTAARVRGYDDDDIELDGMSQHRLVANAAGVLSPACEGMQYRSDPNIIEHGMPDDPLADRWSLT